MACKVRAQFILHHCLHRDLSDDVLDRYIPSQNDTRVNEYLSHRSIDLDIKTHIHVWSIRSSR